MTRRRFLLCCSLLLLSGLALLCLAGLPGCAPPAAPPALDTPPLNMPPPDTPPPGVTANSGGDTRGTVLYQPAPQPSVPAANPYAALSDRFVIGQRQQMAAALVQMDIDAHTQAALKYPVPQLGSPRYSKQFASVRAQQQAKLETQLLEQSRARFCAQYQVTFDQCELLLREARAKHWPLPPG